MSAPKLEVRVLGPVSLVRDGVAVALPRSRKVRVLLAFLALEAAPVSRSRACDLLWDVPNDPRGELRWCLSKLRGVLDDEDRKRVVTAGTSVVELDLRDCLVDALAIERAVRTGLANASNEELDALVGLFGGELLEGLDVDASPELTTWIAAQRRRFVTHHVAVLAEHTSRAEAGSPERFRRVDAWLQRAPFDLRAHQIMLESLVRAGRVRDAEAHVASAIRAFEQEGLDWSELRAAWQEVRAAKDAPRIEVVASLEPEPEVRPSRHGSVAVMPFSEAAGASSIANGLTDDIITRLAKLRVLFVIARGTTYALRDRGVSAQEAGRILDVEYVVSGHVRRTGDRVSVLVELAETRDARIVWTDQLEMVADETFTALDQIVDRIVTGIADEIEAAECRRALIRPPTSLDAWEAYHRGLWHMYRFTADDNRVAERFFRSAVDLDPTFARAYAGLSFTHFQNVFLGLTPDREQQMILATETAGRSLAADDRDPAAHWAMGRAHWLRGSQRESVEELQRTIELSPNFALGHYTLGFVECQSGDPYAAIHAVDHSRQLSPFDPLQFGMLCARAIAHIRLGELDQAAEWSVRAAARPNAHAHILAIAAVSLALANRRDEARELIARVRSRTPDYVVDDLLRAFRLSKDALDLFRRSAREIGFG